MNSCGYLYLSLQSKRLDTLGCYRLAHHSIGSEEKLMVTEIKHFNLGEQWFLIIDNLEEICINKQEHLNLDQKLSLRAQIQRVTTDNCSMFPICQLSSNGTCLQFQLCILSGMVNIVNWKEQHFTQSRTFLFLCKWINLEKWTARQLTHQCWTYRSTCLCALRILSFNENFQRFFNQRVLVITSAKCILVTGSLQE